MQDVFCEVRQERFSKTTHLGDAPLLAVLLHWVHPLRCGAWGKEENSMKAIVQDSYGSPDDVLELKDIDRPVVKDDDALVRVHAAATQR